MSTNEESIKWQALRDLMKLRHGSLEIVMWDSTGTHVLVYYPGGKDPLAYLVTDLTFSGVLQLLAGAGISLSPVGGTGKVTVAATGAGVTLDGVPPNVALTAGSAGVAATAQRSDHTHGHGDLSGDGVTKHSAAQISGLATANVAVHAWTQILPARSNTAVQSTGQGVSLTKKNNGNVLVWADTVFQQAANNTITFPSLYFSTVGIPALGSAPNAGDVQIDSEEYFSGGGLGIPVNVPLTGLKTGASGTFYVYLACYTTSPGQYILEAFGNLLVQEI